MFPVICSSVGFYIITKMLEILYNDTESPVVKISAIATIVLTITAIIFSYLSIININMK